MNMPAIVGRSPYGIYGLAKSPSRVGATGSFKAGSVIMAAGEGALAVALWMPVGFKERHPIWGTILGIGAAFNVLDAVT